MVYFVIGFLALACFYFDHITKRNEKEYNDTFNSALKEVKEEYFREKGIADKRTESDKAKLKKIHQEIGVSDQVDFERAFLEMDRLKHRISYAYKHLDRLHPWNSFRLECIVRTGKDLYK